MKIIWHIEEHDIREIKAFYETHRSNPFVLKRIRRNLEGRVPAISKAVFWKVMVSCLLSTQQRARPNSAVTRFIHTRPFPLRYSDCSKTKNLPHFIVTTLTRFGGIRRARSIAGEAHHNFRWLQDGGWKVVFDALSRLRNDPGAPSERRAAEFLMDRLKGFGPKQTRNLLQDLGLTKYEIPIDSRITKWLNRFGFPIKLSATALSDPNYYNFILDGFQALCRKADILPCVMDAAIFSSFDKE